MWPVFEEQLSHYSDLEKQLAAPAVASDSTRYTRVAKEHGSLAKRVKPYVEFKQISQDLEQAEAMLRVETDAEMRTYAQQEVDALRARHQALRLRLEEFLLTEGEDFD